MRDVCNERAGTRLDLEIRDSYAASHITALMLSRFRPVVLGPLIASGVSRALRANQNSSRVSKRLKILPWRFRRSFRLRQTQRRNLKINHSSGEFHPYGASAMQVAAGDKGTSNFDERPAKGDVKEARVTFRGLTVPVRPRAPEAAAMLRLKRTLQRAAIQRENQDPRPP